MPLSEEHKFEIGIIMLCNNTKLMTLENGTVTLDCPSCDFKSGFPKKKQRKMTVELLKEIVE